MHVSISGIIPPTISGLNSAGGDLKVFHESKRLIKPLTMRGSCFCNRPALGV